MGISLWMLMGFFSLIETTPSNIIRSPQLVIPLCTIEDPSQCGMWLRTILLLLLLFLKFGLCKLTKELKINPIFTVNYCFQFKSKMPDLRSIFNLIVYEMFLKWYQINLF